MSLGKRFSLVTAGVICKLLTTKDIVGLPISYLYQNTLDELVKIAQNEYPGIIDAKRKWYPLL